MRGGALDLLQARFAVARLNRTSLAYMYGSTAPSAVLWAHARRPLPGALTWLAALAWAVCVGLTLWLGATAWRWQARLTEALPAARREVRLEFRPDGAAPAAPVLFALSVLAAAPLWLHGLGATWTPPPVLAFGSAAWLMLASLAVLARCLERWP